MFRYDDNLKGAATMYIYSNVSRDKSGVQYICHLTHSKTSCSISFKLDSTHYVFESNKQKKTETECFKGKAKIRMSDLHMVLVRLRIMCNIHSKCANQCVEFHFCRGKMDTEQRKLYLTLVKCMCHIV